MKSLLVTALTLALSGSALPAAELASASSPIPLASAAKFAGNVHVNYTARVAGRAGPAGRNYAGARGYYRGRPVAGNRSGNGRYANGRYSGSRNYGGRYYGGRGYYGYRRGYYGYPYYGSGVAIGIGLPLYGYYGPGYGYYGAPNAYYDGAPGVYDGRIVEETAPGRLPPVNSGSITRDVQEELIARGFYKGSADGVFGGSSQAALRRFQSANGLSATGTINSATLRALGISR